jgi:phage head maturation protease
MKRDRARVAQIARLLESAAERHNESADATCSVAACFERSDGDLSDETFDRIFEAVAELAGISLHKKPDYLRAARELITKIERMSRREASANVSPRRKHG